MESLRAIGAMLKEKNGFYQLPTCLAHVEKGKHVKAALNFYAY